jgi:hypothetical protein
MAANLDGLVDEIRDAARELDAAVWRAGLRGRFTSTRRSHSEQARLYRAFISGRHPYPVAPPGFSAHEYGEAFDYLVLPSEYQSNVGETWVSWGGTWGGSSDDVHFELEGASARAKAMGEELNLRPDLEPEFGPTPGAAKVFSPGPWWLPGIPSYVDLIKGATHGTHEVMCKLFGKNWC